MPNFMLLATAWGPKFGGINAFNMDFAIGLAKHLKGAGKVFCAVLSPTENDIGDALKHSVTLLAVDRPTNSPGYDQSWALDVWQKFQTEHPGEKIAWWVGHDVTTGWAAVQGPRVAAGEGQSALIMHMNYADYQSYKGGIGERAHQKEIEQRRLFTSADHCFANGPLLRDALKDIVNTDVTMLIPGLAEVTTIPSSHRLHLITFGRMDRESDRIKQGSLAVAAFGSAIKQAWSIVGLPEKLRDNPQMRVVGINESGGEEERALKRLIADRADRQVNLMALRFDEDRTALFEELGRANISLMLSWHEGFGLTGWEALAAEVPLIVSQQTGLWQLLKETLGERLARGHVRAIDVRGREGEDDSTNFRPEDEALVRDAIIEIAADIQSARNSAAKLKRELKEKLICTWEYTAEQFCRGLASRQPDDAVSTGTAAEQHSTMRSPEVIYIPRLDWPEAFNNKGIEIPDSILLSPESRVVPFHKARIPLRNSIISWALDSDQPIKLRLQTGEGGAGKTRLMIEVCDQLARLHGWHAGFVDRTKGATRGFASLLSRDVSALIVLDYAEGRTSEIINLTREALYSGTDINMRIVLLARDGRDWWDRIAEQAGDDRALAAVLRSFKTKTGPYPMSKELIEASDRPAFFNEALNAFAAAKKIGLTDVSAPDLTGPQFGMPLFIHLAALAQLRGGPSADEQDLLGATLEHERRYWLALMNDVGMDREYLPALEQALAMLTLCGGKRSAKESRAVIDRVPRLREVSPPARLRVFDVLRRLYPFENGVSGLQPDLLGEALVGEALADDDELLDTAFGTEDARQDARHALTVLTRLARRVPAEQRWIKSALERYLTNISEDALFVGMETGAPMPEVHAEALRSAARPKRRHAVSMLRGMLPETSLNLADLSIEIGRQAVAFQDEKDWSSRKHHVRHFDSLTALGKALTDNGKFVEAVGTFEEATRHARNVFRSKSDRDREHLGVAIGNLTDSLRRVGRYEAAHLNALENEVIWRELAQRKPRFFRRTWAQSLLSLGFVLEDLGRFAESLELAQQSVRIKRELARSDPKTNRVDLAKGLAALANALDGVGQVAEALRIFRESESVWRTLADEDPDEHRGGWADALLGFGSEILKVGLTEDALRMAEEAEAILRDLSERQPNRYTKAWASSLNSLSLAFRDAGRFDEALTRAEEAERAMRGLADEQPDAHRMRWAQALANLAEALLNASRPSEALATAYEVISIMEPVSSRYPIIYRPWLGFSRRVASDCYLALGQNEEALREAQNAVNIWSETATLRANFESVQVARSFLTLMRCENKLGQSERILEVVKQAFGLLKRPFDENPRPIRSLLSEMIELATQAGHENITSVVPSEMLKITNG